MIDPIKHPHRYAKQRDRILAERVRALAPALCISSIAKKIGMKRIETEELCARHAIPFKSQEKNR